jgi:excinuclease ABC subunit B
MKFDEFEKSLNQVIFVSATPAAYELELTNGIIVEQIIRPTGLLDPEIIIRNTKGQIDDMIGEIHKVVARDERVLITTLTKRMAEDLTEYLQGVNIRSEYMHSDIDTIERVQILRGLRMQKFDVLVGINLLREGLDLPEVSLVIVLDEDKEGFLRSRTSLIQVSGRTARNINGKVILYGDRITDSMQYLMDETDRRRKLQDDYNKKNNVQPKTIYKSLQEIKLSTAVADESGDKYGEDKAIIDDSTLDGIESKETLVILKRKMLKCARDLQFEQAALLRDKIREIEEAVSYG